jgi:iron complex outermembrane receptor protein
MWGFSLGLLVSASAAYGQISHSDTLVHYQLGGIVVDADPLDAASFSPEYRVSGEALQLIGASALSEAGRLIPSAHVVTNSRGESLIYVRAAGERQLGLTLDDAPLAVPWDNRLDLGLLPLLGSASVTVQRGATSALAGPATAGGIIRIRTNLTNDPNLRGRVSLSLGPLASRSGRAHLAKRFDQHGFSVSALYERRSGVRVPESANISYSQSDQETRTNSDRRLAGASARVEFVLSGSADLSLTAFHVDASKGVSPEGHLDPREDRVRYWRYPDWRYTMAVGAFSLRSRRLRLRSSVWTGLFRQTIDQYESDLFEHISAREDDDDVSAGNRTVVSTTLGSWVGRAAAYVSTSRHRQVDSKTADGVLAAEAALVYRSVTYGTALDWTRRWGPAALELSLGTDWLAMPETGDKPGRDPFSGISASSAASVDIRTGWRLMVSAARKVRFPTMREQFGEALERFILNADLGAEESVLTEAAISYRERSLESSLTLFCNWTNGTIDQEVVPNPDGPSRRVRVNLDGSYALGIEAEAVWSAGKGFSAVAHGTWVRARTRNDEDGSSRPLTEKPEIIGGLTVSIARGPVRSHMGAALTGRAWSMAPDGALNELPAAATVSFGADGSISVSGQATIVLHLRVDNLFDTVVLPQLGLPEAGRTIALGTSLNF